MEKKFLVMLSQTFRLGYSCMVCNIRIKFGGNNLALNYSPKQSKNQRSVNEWLLSPKKGISISQIFSIKRINLHIINT